MIKTELKRKHIRHVIQHTAMIREPGMSIMILLYRTGMLQIRINYITVMVMRDNKVKNYHNYGD
jgi:hypothetical protein